MYEVLVFALQDLGGCEVQNHSTKVATVDLEYHFTKLMRVVEINLMYIERNYFIKKSPPTKADEILIDTNLWPGICN